MSPAKVIDTNQWIGQLADDLNKARDLQTAFMRWLAKEERDGATVVRIDDVRSFLAREAA